MGKTYKDKNKFFRERKKNNKKDDYYKQEYEKD